MARLSAPDKAARALLPALPLLPASAVRVLLTPEDHAQARAALLAQRYIGFDTESKPTFNKGETSGGPEVLQLATPGAAFVLQLRHPASEALARELLVAPELVKVGFGIGQDQSQLQHRLGLHSSPLLDLDRVFARQGYPRNVGIQAAVALVFNQRFHKSKKLTTSNWAATTLTAAQLLYAAHDAWVALRVLQGLLTSGMAEAELPVLRHSSPSHHPHPHTASA